MELQERIKQLIWKNTDYRGEIFPESRLINDLHLESLDLLMLLNAIEDEFSIEIKGDNLEGLYRVSDIIGVIQQILDQKAAS